MPTFKRYFRSYFRHSCIPSLHYLVEKRTKLERIYWTVAYLLLVSGMCILIYYVSSVYKDIPMIFSEVYSNDPDLKLKLPAITICHTGVINITKLNNLDFDFVTKLYTFYPQLCKNDKSMASTNGSFIDTQEFFDTYANVSYVYDSITCTSLIETFECSEYFIPLLERDGMCYTYNMFSERDILRDNFMVLNFDNLLDTTGYLFLHGKISALIHWPDQQEDFSDCNDPPVYGLKVKIHDQSSFPVLDTNYFYVAYRESVTAIIQANQFTINPDMAGTNPDYRDCFNKKERVLYYFRKYSQENCEFECLTNATLKECGCVRYFMPRLNTTPVCGMDHLKCTKNVENTFYKVTPLNKQLFKKCDCKPRCTYTKYTVSTNSITETKGDNRKISEINLIFMEKLDYIVEKQELMGPLELFVTIGALVTFSTGITVIAIFEIIYFFPIRMIFNKIYRGAWFKDQ